MSRPIVHARDHWRTGADPAAGQWQDAVLESPWTGTLRYAFDSAGDTELDGDVAGGTVDDVVAYLPGSYWPEEDKVRPGWLTDAGDLVRTRLAAADGAVTIDGIDAAAEITSSTPTSVTGLLKGNGSVISAATAGTDYLVPAAIGSTVEAYDADLAAIAGLSPSNDDVIQRKAGAWTNRTIAQLIADLAALGTTFQPLDSDLTAFAGLSIAADKLPYGTGSHTLGLTDLSSFIRTLLDDPDAATARATLGVIAANVPFTPAGSISSTTVQAAIEEVSSESGGAPDASDVVVTPFGTIAATNVQAALEEIVAEATGGASAIDVQVFDVGAGQTWAKPGGSPKRVKVIAVGSGAGGGGGASAVSTQKTGGSGGGGASVVIAEFDAADLPGTVTVDVAAGGTGGAGGAAGAGAVGSAGNDGDSSTFGGLVTAFAGGGGRGGTTANTAGGAGGSMANSAIGTTGGAPSASTSPIAGQGASNAAGNVGVCAEWGGASGAGANTGAVTRAGGSSVYAGAGGGQGGAVLATNVANGTPGDGGTTQAYVAGGGATGGTSGASPTAGSDGVFVGPYTGQGGGGGGAGAAHAGAKGGDGGLGSGGGGGGAGSNSSASGNAGGAGGGGGDGRVIVITYF